MTLRVKIRLFITFLFTSAIVNSAFIFMLERFSEEDYGDRAKKNIGLVLRLEFFENGQPIYTTETSGKKAYYFLGLREKGGRP